MTDAPELVPVDFYSRMGLLLRDDYQGSEHVREALKIIITAINEPKVVTGNLEPQILTLFRKDGLTSRLTWEALLEFARILDGTVLCPANLPALTKAHVDYDSRMLLGPHEVFMEIARRIQSFKG